MDTTMSYTHLQQKCQTSTKLRTRRDSSLSLSRKIASVVSALALSTLTLTSTASTLQAQTPPKHSKSTKH